MKNVIKEIKFIWDILSMNYIFLPYKYIIIYTWITAKIH